MGREGMLLNLICVLCAVAFVVLAVMNFLAEGSFFSTDSLFITLVWLMLAMLFLAVPGMDLLSRSVIMNRFGFIKSRAPAPTAGATSTTVVTTDAKGRPMPPDVRRMVSDMKSGQKQ
jgi:hypothetical protein